MHPTFDLLASELQRYWAGDAVRFTVPVNPPGSGQANGANPVAIVIPCHRVIGKDGSLVGYAGGLDMKRALLRVERWLFL